MNCFFVFLSGAGQWLQTVGSPVRFWLPQCAIPVVTQHQQQQVKAADQPQQQQQSDVVSDSQQLSWQPAASSLSEEDAPPSIAETDRAEADDTEAGASTAATDSCFYFCRRCEQLFSQQSALSQHECPGLVQSEAVSSTGLHPQAAVPTSKLQCKFCMKVFSRTWTLNVHMRTHTGERPYRCMVCDKAFSDKSNMRQHTLIHTEQKQYKCPGCHQSFAQKRYMKKHHAETCRRKGNDPDNAILQSAPEDTRITDTTSSENKSPVRKPQKSFVIYVPRSNLPPRANLPLSTKSIKTENVDSVEVVRDVSADDAKWDTSIFLAGNKVAVADSDRNDVSAGVNDSANECEVSGQMYACKTCKRILKNERQFKSHKCPKA